MIWIGIDYTDGTRIHHIFRRAMLYVVDGKQHVAGRTLCGAEFTHDTSGARVDVIAPGIYGVDTRPSLSQLVPMHHCEDCQRERIAPTATSQLEPDTN